MNKLAYLIVTLILSVAVSSCGQKDDMYVYKAYTIGKETNTEFERLSVTAYIDIISTSWVFYNIQDEKIGKIQNLHQVDEKESRSDGVYRHKIIYEGILHDYRSKKERNVKVHMDFSDDSETGAGIITVFALTDDSKIRLILH